MKRKLEMSVDESASHMEKIHAAGAQRHGVLWLEANSAAIRAAQAARVDYTTPTNRVMLSNVVLRVLDVAKRAKK